MDRERQALYVILVALLVVLACVLAYGLWAANSNYSAFRADALMHMGLRGLGFSLQAARAQDMLFLKGTALLLAYAIVVVGCLFVLRGIRAYYDLKINTPDWSSALKTSSPGLVLITLGAALVIATLLVPHRLEMKFGDGSGQVASPADNESVSKTARDAAKEYENGKKTPW